MAKEDVKVTIGADISPLSKGIEDAKKQVKGMGDSSEATTSSIGSMFSDIGGKIKGAFSVGAVIDFGKQVVTLGSQFEDSMAKVAALTGATGEEFQELEDLCRNLGETTRYSAQEASDAMGYLAMAGWNSSQMVSGLEDMLSLASASGTDLATTADILSDVLQQFGEDADSAGHFADVFAKTASSSNTNVVMMGQSMKHVGTVAKQLGIGVEETGAMLGTMANNGVKAGQAGRHLKIILSRLSGDMPPVTAALEEMGLSVKDGNGNMKDMGVILSEMKGKFDNMSESQRINTAKSIAGADAMASFLALVSGAGPDFDNFVASLENSDGAAKEMADTMENTLQGSLRSLESAWEETQLQISDSISGTVKAWVDGGVEILRGINSLKDGATEFSTGFSSSVSEGVANAVTPFAEMNRVIQGTAQELQILGGPVTEEMYTSMTTALTQWSEESTKTLDEAYQKDLELLTQYFADNKDISDEKRKEMLDNLASHYGVLKEETKKNQDEITAMLEESLNTGKELTSEQLDTIVRLQDENYTNLLRMMDTNIAEEMALLQAKGNQSDLIQREACEKAFKTAKETREKVLAEAEKQMDESILQAHRLREAGVIQEDEYQKMVETAQTKFDDIKTKADENFTKVYETVNEKAKEMNVTFDHNTGSMLSGWKKLLNFVVGNPLSFEATYNVTTKKKTIDLGTTSGDGGGSTRTVVPEPIATRTRFAMLDTVADGETTYNNSSNPINIAMNGITIREESDIRKIAQELHRLQNRTKRGQGSYV